MGGSEAARAFTAVGGVATTCCEGCNRGCGAASSFSDRRKVKASGAGGATGPCGAMADWLAASGGTPSVEPLPGIDADWGSAVCELAPGRRDVPCAGGPAEEADSDGSADGGLGGVGNAGSAGVESETSATGAELRGPLFDVSSPGAPDLPPAGFTCRRSKLWVDSGAAPLAGTVGSAFGAGAWNAVLNGVISIERINARAVSRGEAAVTRSGGFPDWEPSFAGAVATAGSGSSAAVSRLTRRAKAVPGAAGVTAV